MYRYIGIRKIHFVILLQKVSIVLEVIGQLGIQVGIVSLVVFKLGHLKQAVEEGGGGEI